MKNIQTALVGLALVTGLGSVGCGGLARTAEVYRDDTQKLLETKASEGITTCYNQVLKTNPTAQGSVTARFVVYPGTGKLHRIKIDEARSSAPAPVQECVRQYIDALVLEPADTQAGHATFSWNFTFKVPPSPPAAAPEAAPTDGTKLVPPAT